MLDAWFIVVVAEKLLLWILRLLLYIYIIRFRKHLPVNLEIDFS